MENFKVKINGREAQDLFFPCGVYQYAALAALSLTIEEDHPEGYFKPIHIEIWCERLLPEYGPYHYLLKINEFGDLVARTARLASQ